MLIPDPQIESKLNMLCRSESAHYLTQTVLDYTISCGPTI